MATDEAVEPHDDAFCQTELADCFGGVARACGGVVACRTGERADVVLVEADKDVGWRVFWPGDVDYCVAGDRVGARDAPRFFGGESDGECAEQDGCS